MKKYLARQVAAARDAGEGRNRVREYLQARILGVLQRAGAMVPLAFCGGTALRILYGLPRFSEDLDFALEHHVELYRFRGWLSEIRREFALEGYRVDLKVSDRTAVHSAFVSFAGLMNELGLSGRAEEKISVKVEVDSRPPAGAGLEKTLVRVHGLLHLQHHDRPSLLAGKVHALLNRPWLKGRDVFDLLWYLGDRSWPEPNFTLLNNALAQTGWEGETLGAENWRRVAAERIGRLPWERVVEDVAPFLEPGAGAELLTRENLLHLLGDKGQGEGRN